MISYVASHKDKNLGDYFFSRISRLYSVVIPAIIITIVCDQIGRKINENLYLSVYSDSYPIVRVLSNMFFVQEFWGAGIRLFSNGPFWSLSYEFSYYVLFGVIFYLRGFNRLFIFLAVAVLVGPNILLLAPIWFLGVAIERMKITPSILWSFLGAIVVPVFYFYYKNTIQDSLPIFDELGYSKRFLSDYCIGVMIALEILFVRGVLKHQQLNNYNSGYLGGVIRYLASYTFSLYLYHFPLLLVFYAIASYLNLGGMEIPFVIFSVFISVKLLGDLTEKKKHTYRKLIIWIVQTTVRMVKIKG